MSPINIQSKDLVPCIHEGDGTKPNDQNTEQRHIIEGIENDMKVMGKGKENKK